MNLLEDGGDPTAPLRDELLAKWKDKPQEELLKAKIESDLHIKNLEKEAAERHQMYTELYEKSKTQASLEALIDQIKNEKNQVAQPPANEVIQPAMDENKLRDVFKQEISTYETQKKEVENFGKVQSKLKEKLGPNYASSLADHYNSLGLTNEEMNALAKKSPEAYFRVLGLNEVFQDGFTAPPRSNQRNDSFAPKTVKRDYAYYQELKKTNPKLYLDPKISQQMERDYAALGDAFGLPA